MVFTAAPPSGVRDDTAGSHRTLGSLEPMGYADTALEQMDGRLV